MFYLEYSLMCVLVVGCLCSMWLKSGTSEIWHWRWNLLCSYQDLKLRFDRRKTGHTILQWSIIHNQSHVLLVQELVELVLTDLQMKPGTEVGTQETCLEVGCGSGAISLSLLKSWPQVRFVLIEGRRHLRCISSNIWWINIFPRE